MSASSPIHASDVTSDRRRPFHTGRFTPPGCPCRIQMVPETVSGDTVELLATTDPEPSPSHGGRRR